MQVIKDHIAYRYELLEVMGQGGFGRVFKCRDHRTKQLVAMKVIVKNQRYLIGLSTNIQNFNIYLNSF